MEGNTDTPKQLELSDERLSLFQALQRRSKRIAQMYTGAHFALKDSGNPERFCCAAHEIRELMEKVPEIVDVRAQAQRELIFDKSRKLETAYDAALGRTQLRAPKWNGTVDAAMTGLLEELRNFIEWMKAHLPKRREEILNTFRALDGSGNVLPPDMEREMVKGWMEMRRFFQNVAHHQFETTPEQFDERLRGLESFLLRKLNPPTFPNFDEIDAIVEEGEGK